MTSRNTKKLDDMIEEFKKEGIPIGPNQCINKKMDFNEPSNVEKDFQNVSFIILTNDIAYAKDERKA